MTAALCACGCGGATTLITASCASRGDVRGQYRTWLRGHTPGGKWIASGGYVYLGTKAGIRPEQVAMVEAAIGHRLPRGAVVHHVNRDRADNANANFVACQDHAYHMLLHMRQRALDACGDANARRCIFCKRYDNQSDVTVAHPASGKARAYHRACNAKYLRDFRARRRANLREASI